jgi:ParB-like chromosome segregation protein Spo0J
MKYILTEKQYKFLLEGLHDTSWQNEEGDKITLIDLLDSTKDIPVQELSVKQLEPHLLTWDDNDEEIAKIEKADLKYPILIFVNDDGDFITIIDGHHRAQKAVRKGLDTIKAKVITLSSLPKKIRKVFSHLR